MPTPQGLCPHPHPKNQPPHGVGVRLWGCCFHPLNLQGQAGDGVQEMPGVSAGACRMETDVLRS